MVTIIDSVGRTSRLKQLRKEGFSQPGQEFELSAVGRFEIEHQVTPMRLERRGTRLVAVADRDMPTLTAEMVRETLEQVRRCHRTVAS